MKEVWKDVKGYEGRNQVSNLGRVKSLSSDIYLKPSIDGKGYLRCSLSKNNKRKTFKVHRLVALSFIDNTNNKPQVNHIDGNKQNNNVNNLEWSTNSENVKHGYDLGLQKRKNSKLTIEEAKFIKQAYVNGENIYKLWKENFKHKVGKSAMQACASGKQYIGGEFT